MAKRVRLASVQSSVPERPPERTRVLIVDLASQRVIRTNGESFSFEIDPSTKHSLIEGLDEIGQTLTHDAEIAAFEAKQRIGQPWLWA